MINREQTYDLLVAKHLDEVASLAGSEKQKKLVGLGQQLLGDYGFTAHQTYLRPSHPDPEKRTSALGTMVCVLISLRTTLENERIATERLFNAFPDPQMLLTVPEDLIAGHIQPAGMASKKARAIKNAVAFVCKHYGSDFEHLRGKSMEEMRALLLRIPGIGPKAADCILELGLDAPSFVVDVNVFRFTARYFGVLEDAVLDTGNAQQLAHVKSFLEEDLPKDALLFQVLHTVYLLHGKMVCKSVPKCSTCALRGTCATYQA